MESQVKDIIKSFEEIKENINTKIKKKIINLEFMDQELKAKLN